MYRLLTALSMPDGAFWPEGKVDRLAMLSPRVLGLLEDAGRIVPISTPPLAVLDGWVVRARRLKARAGIETVEALVEADVGETAALIGVQPETIARWREEALAACRL